LEMTDINDVKSEMQTPSKEPVMPSLTQNRATSNDVISHDQITFTVEVERAFSPSDNMR